MKKIKITKAEETKLKGVLLKMMVETGGEKVRLPELMKLLKKFKVSKKHAAYIYQTLQEMGLVA